MKRLVLYFLLFSSFFACQSKKEQAQDNQKVSPKKEVKRAFPEPKEDSALIEINNNLRNDINNPDLYVDRARWYLDKGEKAAAIEDINRAFKIDSLNQKTLLIQAELFLKSGRLDASKRILDKTLLTYPTSSNAHLLMAELYLIGSDYISSIKYADLAIKHDMFNEKAYYVKGFSFLELGDTAKAISSIQTAVEQNPEYYDGYLQLGLIYSALNNSLAIDYFNNALEVKPNDKNALYSMGMYQQNHEMFNEAMKTYTQAIKAHPDFREAYYNMGYLHMFYLKLYREGLKYFTQAIEVDPKYYQAYYNRGYSFELMGDINNAAKDYNKALSIQPNYDLAAQGLSRVKQN